MSKAYGKNDYIQHKLWFYEHSPEKFRIYCDKKRKLLHFCFCGEIKNKSCMVSRQRQSEITHKGSEMSSFSRCASVLLISFLKKPPNVVQHHVFVILSMATMFKVQYILMKALALLLWVSSHVLLQFFKMSVKDMDFERHSASNFAIILYESLKQLHIIFSLVITQEATNNCNQTVPSRFLLPFQRLGEHVTFYDLLDLRSNEDTSLDLCLGQLWKKNLEPLESCWILAKSSDKLLDEAWHDVQWWHQHLMRFYQWLPFDVALPHRELGLLWPFLPVIVHCSVTAVLEAKQTRKFCEVALKATQEWHHFEISNDLPSIVVILQGTQQHLDTGIVLFELHRVSHKERRVVVSVVKQHVFEALGWTVYE